MEGDLLASKQPLNLALTLALALPPANILLAPASAPRLPACLLQNEIQSALPKIVTAGFKAVRLIYYFTAGVQEVGGRVPVSAAGESIRADGAANKHAPPGQSAWLGVDSQRLPALAALLCLAAWLCAQAVLVHRHIPHSTRSHPRVATLPGRCAGAVLADPGAHQGAPGGGRHPL